MTKQEIIADIRMRNQTASEEFLAGFSEEDLLAYLSNLKEVVPIPMGDQQRRTQARHSLSGMTRPIRGPILTSYKPYMGRPTRASTTSCVKRPRHSVLLG